MEKLRALVLLSNGLDSRVALKIMSENLGTKNVEAISFKIPFSSDKNTFQSAVEFCKEQKIKLTVFDLTSGDLFKEYLGIIRKPKHQRGTALNPCIDCHIFMLKKAKEYADKNNIELVVTGEVLGERPLSQNKRALAIVEKESGLKGRLLRVLSAKLLEKTDAEKRGILDSNILLDIQGRTRKRQIEIAKQFKITFPTPGGGCLICEREYCKKLKEILYDNISYTDIFLLKVGRHFNKSQIILGKNEKENLILEKQEGIKIIPEDSGPTALVRANSEEAYNLIEQAKLLINKYSKNPKNNFEIIK